MPTIDATVGGEHANSYITLDAADTFFDERVGSTAWAEASEDDRKRALIQATRILDRERFVGRPVRPLVDEHASGLRQALQWPRHATGEDGRYYAPDRIPSAVQRAQLLLALALLDGSFTTDATGLEGFEEVAVDVIKVKPARGRRSDSMPSQVRSELRGLLDSPSAMNFRIWRA